eukprot:TRINITY_DN3171_c0_g1_i1.p1 TRINITY_DN3171_c0_g1~~TRINITY_DN3171_c0_g1_i1.p1  ORF type:complete len:614 (+),score=212.47 TRINITY_DN3171_c0_g1_i1:66-1844(+)
MPGRKKRGKRKGSSRAPDDVVEAEPQHVAAVTPDAAHAPALQPSPTQPQPEGPQDGASTPTEELAPPPQRQVPTPPPPPQATVVTELPPPLPPQSSGFPSKFMKGGRLQRSGPARAVCPQRAAPRAVQKRRVLDGFTLLEKCRVEDPEEAVEAMAADCGVAGVVPEDLTFFTALEFLDLGGNRVELDSLAGLTTLQELHLHANGLSTLAVPPLSFPRLQTLNLSYNNLGWKALAEVATFLPSLVRLDVSHNPLCRLPDLSGLINLRQLAVERCSLGNKGTFEALAGLPELQECNLAGNQLSRVPRLPPPALGKVGVLGLASCTFLDPSDLAALAELPALRRVVLWRNPIERKSSALQQLAELLPGVTVLLEGPVPPKRSAADFYASVVAKGGVRKVRTEVSFLRKRKSLTAPPPHRSPEASTPPPQIEALDSGDTPEPAGGALFITELGSAPVARKRRAGMDTPETMSTATGGRWRPRAITQGPEHVPDDLAADMQCLLEESPTPVAGAGADAVDPRPRWAGPRYFEKPPATLKGALNELRLVLRYPPSLARSEVDEAASIRTLCRRSGKRRDPGQPRAQLPPLSIPAAAPA